MRFNTTTPLKFLFLLVCSFGLLAETWKGVPLIGPSMDGPVQSEIGDMNEDGVLDIVVISINDGSLRWFEGTNGAYIEHEITKGLIGLIDLKLVDLDKDEDLDILVSSLNNTSILWFENRNLLNNSWQQHDLIETDSSVITIACEDLNGDGRIDIVSATQESSEISIHYQQQNMIFHTQKIQTDFQGVSKVVIGDLNNDGRSDIITASQQDNTISVFTQSRKEAFELYDEIRSANGVWTIHLKDIDSDGDLDILAALFDDGLFMWYENKGQKFIHHHLPGMALGAYDVSSIDVDNDGDIDIFGNSIRDGILRVYINNGKQSFNPVIISNNLDGLVSISLNDLNGDHIPDIVSEAFYDNNIHVFLSEINDDEFFYTDAIISVYANGATNVIVDDFDADGDLDIVSTSFHDNELLLFSNNSNKFIKSVLSSNVDGPRELTHFDIDSDGDIDIVSSGAWDDTFWLHKNMLSETNVFAFKDEMIFSKANNASGLTYADMNMDGQMDLVGASSLDDSIRWFEKTDNGFKPHLISDSSDGVISIDSKDMDNDGDYDVVVANLFASSIQIFENKNGYEFAKHEVFSNALNVFNVIAADINGDGLEDIVSVSMNDSSLRWYKNNGDLTFTPLLISDQLFQVRAVSVEDYNNDGQLDIAVSSNNNSNVSLFLRDSSSTIFNEKVIFEGARHFYNFFSADMNDDGLKDLVSASYDDDSIRVIYQFNLGLDESREK